jgi:hypothetical protein
LEGNVLLRAGGWARMLVAALSVLSVGGAAKASSSLEERKLPMKFSWNADSASQTCAPQCNGWVTAVGLITSDTLKEFDKFATKHDVRGATIVLDSGGGSVLDAIKLGRRWRDLKVSTTVGMAVQMPATPMGTARPTILPQAYCESMCVFLLLSGVNRYVPPAAHIRVHQIWMGDRAEDARAASYSADDVSIIERDIGRLARYTFEMGGTGDLLELSLSVPPWKPLRQLTMEEIRQAKLSSVENLSDLMPNSQSVPVAAVPEAAVKPVQDRLVGSPQRTADAQSAAN